MPLIVISEYRYRRKSLFCVAGTVKLYRYNRNIVIIEIVINGVKCIRYTLQLIKLIKSVTKCERGGIRAFYKAFTNCEFAGSLHLGADE